MFCQSDPSEKTPSSYALQVLNLPYPALICSYPFLYGLRPGLQLLALSSETTVFICAPPLLPLRLVGHITLTILASNLVFRSQRLSYVSTSARGFMDHLFIRTKWQQSIRTDVHLSSLSVVTGPFKGLYPSYLQSVKKMFCKIQIVSEIYKIMFFCKFTNVEVYISKRPNSPQSRMRVLVNHDRVSLEVILSHPNYPYLRCNVKTKKTIRYPEFVT